MDGLFSLPCGQPNAMYGVASGRMRIEDYICVVDEKAQNTNGGTFTSGAWRTRDLNVIRHDAGGHCSLSANQIFLRAGTYRTYFVATVYSVNRHQLRLQDVATGTTLVLGRCGFSYTMTAQEHHTSGVGRFTIPSSRAIELQHSCDLTTATYGFGVACNFGVEVYSSIEFFRENF